jgi:hypothetical protein
MVNESVDARVFRRVLQAIPTHFDPRDTSICIARARSTRSISPASRCTTGAASSSMRRKPRAVFGGSANRATRRPEPDTEPGRRYSQSRRIWRRT